MEVSEHSNRLAGGFQHRSPDVAFGINLASATGYQVEWNMNKRIMPATDQHICLSRHPGMNCVLGQNCAIDVILRRCGHASNGVTGVDILECYWHICRLEEMTDLISQKGADIAQTRVSGSIGTCRIGAQQTLPCAFGNDDHGVFAQSNPVPQRLKKTIGSIQFEVDFWNETKVDLLTGLSN
jgi:hypothetical protein